MKYPELSISVGELLGVPRVVLRGSMDGWHDQAIRGVLEGFSDQGVSSVVLDLAELTFFGVDGATGMINVLRSLGPGMCVHLVAEGSCRDILHRAKFPPSVRLYSSTDELAEQVSCSEECFTSRCREQIYEDGELPLIRESGMLRKAA
jgi:anti-anti-sigma regulatory factor